MPSPELDELLSVGFDDVLVGHLRPRAGARLGFSLEASGRDLVRHLNRFQSKWIEADRDEPLADPTGELGERALERLVVRGTGMPPIGATALGERDRMLHERDTLPFERAGNERVWRIGDAPEGRERLSQSANIVAVTRHDVPAESAEALLEVAEGDDLLRRLVGLELVPIDDDDEVSQTFLRRRLEPLVVLALLQLAVAGHHDDAAPTSKVALRPRHSTALRDPHAERARVRLDPRNADVGVSVEATETPKS